MIGELLTFPDPAAALHRLDRLEGFRPEGPRHYDRIMLDVRPVAGGETIRAWCYVYPEERILGLSEKAVVPGGDWARPR